MTVGDSCQVYTNSIVKYTAPDSISCLLSFADIIKGCKNRAPIIIFDDCYTFDEIEIRDFPTEFYKYVPAKQTVSIVIIHPVEINYNLILSRIGVQRIRKNDYEGNAMDVLPALSHYSIRSDIIVIPVLNREEDVFDQ